MFNGSQNVITVAILILTAAGTVAGILFTEELEAAIAFALFGLYLSASPRMIREWERGVLLRLGRFHRVLSPGIAWVIPGADMMVALVDMRIRSTSFSAEKTLTKDTVPVNVDAVLFWVVTDAQRSVLEVERFRETISWAAQTTLRDVIGKSELVQMISDRESLDTELQRIIDAKTSEWGITVQSVEIRDVRLPAGLEDAMSRMAQADREKEARVILAQSEMKVAEQMRMASEVYAKNPTAMQLRAMNMAYESIKERGALMVVPSALANSMNQEVVGLAAATGFTHDGGAA
jgi:regulator of protease activity HflC (stomatin/prohibitin superfamily)